MIISKTGERIIPEEFKSKEEYVLYLRHLFAYEFAKEKITKGNFVLEVGCGEGYGTKLLSKNAAKIIGLDVDRDIIAHALNKYKSEKCIFKVYDGLNISYQDDTFDAVVSLQVIEHIQDDINYVSEIYRVLKKNGIFILTTPNRTYRLRPGQKPLNRFHKREYYPHELENVLRNKFSDVKIWGVCGNEEVKKIEIERLKLGLIVSLVPLNLRKLMLKPVKSIITKILKRIIHRNQRNKSDRDFLNRYSLKDFYAIKNNIKDSLDLLGICKK